jgi:prepilin-type N-terminal cleavage/methylation domain-containing protein
MKQFILNPKNFRTAFTMFELLIVIIVMGVLAAMALPRYENDIRQEAADNLLSAIRYTRLMALTDNVVNPRNSKWQRAFWRFGIEGCSDDGIFYYVSSDKDYEGDIDTDEIVNDPTNGLHLMGDNQSPCENEVQKNASPNIFLTKRFGIKEGDIDICTDGGKYIGFDYLGRPHRGFAGNNGSTSPDYSSLLHSDCTITVKFGNSGLSPMKIVVEAGTGHTYIKGQPDS